jgi:hypothetical protein
VTSRGGLGKKSRIHLREARRRSREDARDMGKIEMRPRDPLDILGELLRKRRDDDDTADIIREQFVAQLGEEHYADAFMTGSMRPIIEMLEQIIRDQYRQRQSLSIVVHPPSDEDKRNRVVRYDISYDGMCAPRDGTVCRRYRIGDGACTRYGGLMPCLSPDAGAR